MNSPLKIALVAGEASGDLLAASLVEALKVRQPDIHCYGIAGPKMQEAGVEAWHEAEELAVFGLFEVLGHLRRLLRLRKKLIQRLLLDPPDIFIGIDEPTTEDILDMAGEISNVIAGSVRANYGNEFNISVPIVFEGMPKQLKFPSEVAVFVIPMKWKGHEAFLVVGLE